MQYVTFLCAVTLVGLSTAAVTREHGRGCRYILGKCYEECPVGTYSYTMDCGYMTPEPTCEEPDPEAEADIVCDYSACYCDPPTVRDKASDKCVPVDKCPKYVSSEPKN